MRADRSFPQVLILFLPFVFALAFRLAPLPYALAFHLGEAQTAEAERKAAEAADHLREVLAIEPWRGQLWERIGRLALQASDWQQALFAFGQAESAGALTANGRRSLGRVYAEMGNTQDALRTWQALLDSGQASAEVYGDLAGLHRRQGDLATALQVLRKWLSVDPQNQTARYELALLTAVADPSAAPALLKSLSSASPLAAKLKTLRQLFQDLPEDKAYGQVMLGRALGELGEWDLAALAFAEAVHIQPDYAEAWALLGEARQQSGLDGWPELRRAQALNPASVVVQSLLALNWRRQGRVDLALAYLQAIAAQEPQEGAWQMELGNVLAELRDHRAALNHYQRAVELAPTNSEYWFALARFCTVHRLDLRSTGLPAARQALMLEPEDPETLDLMGWALMELEDPFGAERFLQRALRIDNSLAAAHLHLGQVYLQMGESQLAYAHLWQASRLAEPEDEERQLADRLIARYYR